MFLMEKGIVSYYEMFISISDESDCMKKERFIPEEIISYIKPFWNFS